MNYTAILEKIKSNLQINVDNYDYVVFFDGACAPVNPLGEMGIGVLILDQNRNAVLELSENFAPNEINSNNVAEHLALNAAMKWFKDNSQTDKKVIFLGDSTLVVRQMNGWWKIKNGRYYDFAIENEELKSLFNFASFTFIPREFNGVADMLSKSKLTFDTKHFSLKDFYDIHRFRTDKDRLEYLLLQWSKNKS